MTQEEAIARCEQLNGENPHGPRWFASRVGTDEWHVVTATGLGSGATGPLHASVESRPVPQNPPDPRPSIIRNIPPYGA